MCAGTCQSRQGHGKLSDDDYCLLISVLKNENATEPVEFLVQLYSVLPIAAKNRTIIITVLAAQ